MHVLIFTLVFVHVLCFAQENYYFISTIYPVDDVKRRDTVYLQSNRKSFTNDNSAYYRRTKDIRKNGVDRRFEITEAQLREAQREAQIESQNEAIKEAQRLELYKNYLVNEIRENNIDSAQDRNEMRRPVQARDDDWGILDKRENGFGYINNDRRNLRVGQRGRLLR